MGTQIVIKAEDMAKAGWTAVHTVEDDRVVDYGEGDYPETIPGDCWTTWVHTDGTKLKAYYSPDFVCDCKSGGHNEALFQKLGLMALPNTLW